MEDSFNEDDQKWLEDIAKNIQLNIESIYLHQETMSITEKVFNAFSKLWAILIAIVLLSMTALVLILLSVWLVV